MDVSAAEAAIELSRHRGGRKRSPPSARLKYRFKSYRLNVRLRPAAAVNVLMGWVRLERTSRHLARQDFSRSEIGASLAG